MTMINLSNLIEFKYKTIHQIMYKMCYKCIKTEALINFVMILILLNSIF